MTNSPKFSKNYSNFSRKFSNLSNNEEKKKKIPTITFKLEDFE